MDSFYVKVDNILLRMLEPHLKTTLEMQVKNMTDQFNLEKERNLSLKDADRESYLRMCPYCNNFYLLQTRRGHVGAKFCVMCGESSPFEKITYSLEKVSILYQISTFIASNEGNKDEIKNERVLLEQCIVVLATGIEIFLKDIFAISMDLLFVKNEHSLFSKFYKESKNDFVNVGKGKEKFNSELNINLDLLLGTEILKELNVIMLKRNVIVHNNGIADKPFTNQAGIKCNLGQPIPISTEDISHYISTVETLVNKIKEEFDISVFPELLKKASFHLNKYI